MLFVASYPVWHAVSGVCKLYYVAWSIDMVTYWYLAVT